MNIQPRNIIGLDCPNQMGYRTHTLSFYRNCDLYSVLTTKHPNQIHLGRKELPSRKQMLPNKPRVALESCSHRGLYTMELESVVVGSVGWLPTGVTTCALDVNTSRLLVPTTTLSNRNVNRRSAGARGLDMVNVLYDHTILPEVTAMPMPLQTLHTSTRCLLAVTSSMRPDDVNRLTCMYSAPTR